MDRKTWKTNVLEAIPVCREHVVTEWDGPLAVLAYPRFKSSWMRRFFLPKRMDPFIRVHLEEHGTAVWRLIDGRNTVAQIIGQLETHFAGEENYGIRVATYIMQLHKDGFVRLLSL